jgi:hypothetical protein
MPKATTPPNDARRIWRVADLPKDRGSASYMIRNGDETPREVTLDKRQRQVLDLLRAGPVYAASPVRLSDIVHILKRDIELDVETVRYPGDPATGSGSFGIYFLRSSVTPFIETEAAA